MGKREVEGEGEERMSRGNGESNGKEGRGEERKREDRRGQEGTGGERKRNRNMMIDFIEMNCTFEVIDL